MLYKNFIYFINDIKHLESEKFNLSEELIMSINSNNLKLVFIFSSKCNFGEEFEHFYYLSKFSLKNNLKKENMLIITSNMNAKNKYDDLVSLNLLMDNIKICPFYTNY